jgi:hypothetical protein
MVNSIYFVKIPYSDFSEFKGRPILIFKELDNDFLFLPLTSNLDRDGILLDNNDLENGTLRKESIVIVPKINAIDKNLIKKSRLIAKIKNKKYDEIISSLCKSIGCTNE